MQIDVKVTPGKYGTAAFEAAVAAEEVSDRWRLHVVLAEGEVQYQAPNGVPVHEMVVRKIYTSSQGLEPTGGSLALSGSIDPEQIRKEMNQQFQALQELQFEAAKEALAAGQDPELLAKQTAVLKERLDKELKEIPLDLDDLYLVAFVQDSRSQRIRQAVSVPLASPSGAASVSP